MTNHPIAVESESAAPATTRLAKPVKRLIGFIAPLNLVIYAVLTAVPGYFLPLQLQALDDATTERNLGIILGTGTAVALVVAPIAGMISDRTRSRFGRRAPWMVGGALLTGLALVYLGTASSFVQLLVGFIMLQLTVNILLSPLAALLPERIPLVARGLFSSLAGLGLMLGSLGGAIYGATFAKHISAGYFVIPGLLIVLVVIFVVVIPDPSSKDQVNERFSFIVFVKTFWVSPRRFPDFAWGFWGRITLFAGYFLIHGYSLLILQKYIGLGENAVSRAPLVTLVGLVGSLAALGVAGPLSDRLGRRKPIVIASALIMGVGMLVPFFLPTLLGMFVFSFIAGVGFGGYLSADAALMSELLPSEDSYAKDLGVLNIAATLPQSIGPFLASAIVVAFGYAPMFPVGFVLAIVGALCIIPIRSVR